MKKIITGILIGFIVSLPVSVFASSTLKFTKNIYRVSDLDGTSNTVSVFDDRGNKCYVLSSNGYYNSGANSISCVKD